MSTTRIEFGYRDGDGEHWPGIYDLNDEMIEIYREHWADRGGELIGRVAMYGPTTAIPAAGDQDRLWRKLVEAKIATLRAQIGGTGE